MKSVFDRLQFPCRSVFDRLDFKHQDRPQPHKQRILGQQPQQSFRFRNQRSWVATAKKKVPSRVHERRPIRNSNVTTGLKWVPKSKAHVEKKA